MPPGSLSYTARLMPWPLSYAAHLDAAVPPYPRMPRVLALATSAPCVAQAASGHLLYESSGALYHVLPGRRMPCASALVHTASGTLCASHPRSRHERSLCRPGGLRAPSLRAVGCLAPRSPGSSSALRLCSRPYGSLVLCTTLLRAIERPMFSLSYIWAVGRLAPRSSRIVERSAFPLPSIGLAGRLAPLLPHGSTPASPDAASGHLALRVVGRRAPRSLGSSCALRLRSRLYGPSGVLHHAPSSHRAPRAPALVHIGRRAPCTMLLPGRRVLRVLALVYLGRRAPCAPALSWVDSYFTR
ncbi:hypothetical protein C8J57DRAFT_505770 [Mycena rebaudengoi]|nr:hypothetical protein C8J57DRAFT_505770 [Mycena rebaudengoi]